METVQWSLWVIGGLLLVVAFACGQYNADRTRHSIRSLLMLTSALLVVMAALFWLGAARNTPLSSFSLFIAFGMAASFVGDLIMAEYIRTPQRVVFGIAAFGLAHLLYITGYLGAVQALNLKLEAAGWGLAAGFVILGLGLWFTAVRSSEVSPALNYGALGYSLLLAAMAGLAASLALASSRLWTLALGAILFLASDTLLAHQIFRKRNWLLANDVIWVLYISGQALIVWSNMPALRLLNPGGAG